jgi:hypothetical protein
MLNFFQYLNNLLFSKNTKNCGQENCSEKLNGHMLNKWASFYDKQTCLLVNFFCNKPHLTEDPDLLSKFLFIFIPKKDYKKINYIKKNKEKNGTYEFKRVLSKILELGNRDIELILKHADSKTIETFLKIYYDE